MKRDHDDDDEGVEVALHHDYPFFNPDLLHRNLGQRM